jgi:hypothetical protein
MIIMTVGKSWLFLPDFLVKEAVEFWGNITEVF